MIDVKFNRNRRNALSEIKFENMQGMNCVDNNSVLPAHQVPFAFNVDFGRQIGAAAKRYGLESMITTLGASKILSQHCFRSSAGDIPLIAHGTDLYKLSGVSTTRTTDTEVEFNAGTLTDVVVLSDVAAPATAPTLTISSGTGLTGDYYGKVTYIAADGAESDLSVASNKVTITDNVIYWSNIPTGPAGTMQRKLYRTRADGSIYYLLATLDDNTTTTYTDTVADSSLTTQHPGSKRVILGPGDTRNYSAIISEDYYSDTSAVTPSYTVGQTFTVPAGQRKIYSISPYLLNFEAADSITLTLYTDTTKTTVVSSATLSGAQVSGNVEFVLPDADVTPGEVYYFELSSSVTGTSVSVRWRGGPVYSGGNLYLNGVSQPNYDMTFKVYGCKYAEIGTYESEVIDLITAPTQATLTFTETLNSQTITWYAKKSNDNVVWGDYQAVVLTGDGIPLGRYVRVKCVLASDNGTFTPTVINYTISYSTGFGTATSIKGSLSGSKVRFTDWDDRVWFCDGVKNFVYDGGFVAAPATVPTVTTSGSGSLTAGTYRCKVSYVNSDGTEGLPCAEVSVSPSGTFLQFNWSAIPTTLGYTRKLYRTKKDGSIFYLVATLNATDTTYTDTTADASLTTAITTHTGHNVLELGSGSTKPPASTIIHIHKNYAFFVEAAVPSRVYVSTVAKPDKIPSANYFQFPSAVLSLKTYGDYLIASGTDFTWYSAGEIWDVDPAVGDWSWKVVSSTIGCISHEGMWECLDSADNEIIIFPLATGIKYLNANLMGTDLHSVPLSRNVQPYFDQAISRENMAAIFFDQAYYITFNWSNPAETADNHNNAVFKLDLRNREWSGLWGMDITGFFVANNELYMTSSTCGRVYKYSGSDDDGLPIDMIVDSSYVGDAYNKRRFTKAVARIKKGCDTASSTLLVRCDNTERTITLGANTAWAGAGGSPRTVQDEIVSPPRTISGGRAHNVGWRFEDNTANDMVLYGITIMAEPIS